MKVHHFVIHHIQKDQFRHPTPQLRKTEADLSKPKNADAKKPDLIHKFVQSAATMFDRQRSGKVYADIGKEVNTFSELLDRYLAGRFQTGTPVRPTQPYSVTFSRKENNHSGQSPSI